MSWAGRSFKTSFAPGAPESHYVREASYSGRPDTTGEPSRGLTAYLATIPDIRRLGLSSHNLFSLKTVLYCNMLCPKRTIQRNATRSFATEALTSCRNGHCICY